MAIVFRDVPYGSHPRQKINLYQPSNYNIVTEYGIPIRGVILWIHGGGWASGNKDTSSANYKTYFDSASWSYIEQHINWNSNYLDDDFCKFISDRGYFVLSTNYRLIGDGGEYPNNINDIEELYKWIVSPGYAPSSDINKATWDLIVRYINTYGLLVIGGSAGGHLAVAGAFEGAGKTGKWPRGIGSIVSPLNLDYSSSGTAALVGQLGKTLIDNYATTDATKHRQASPWWRTNPTYNPNGISYNNYFNFSDTITNKRMRMYFFYNTNDNLVPLGTAEEFINNFASATLGAGMVKYNKVTENDPFGATYNYKGVWSSSTSYATYDVALYNGVMYRTSNPTAGTIPSAGFPWSPFGESHNIYTSGDSWLLEASSFTFGQGLVFPKGNSKVRPTSSNWSYTGGTTGYGEVRGMVYPRQRNYRYKAPNTVPSYPV